MTISPITLFVYNRPLHTKQTVETLKRNKLAKKSEFFIFSDGPKDERGREKVEEVRNYIRTISGFKKVTIIESEINLGLAKSIISGITDILNKYGKIIVLEDDLVLSAYFLTYMNKALELYKNEDKVMHISGYMYPIKSHDLPDTFFFNQASCWGWGTWKRAWSHLDTDPEKLLTKIRERKKEKIFNYYGYYNFINQLNGNINGKLNTWAVKWYASIFLRHGLCLHPKISLVNNIGLDGSGINCPTSSIYTIPKTATKIVVKKIKLKESSVVKDRMIDFYKKNFSIIKQSRQKLSKIMEILKFEINIWQ